MLISLTIKNFTLIDSEEIEFRRGLNILTGETGAGKSIILGALALALGGKVDKNIIRNPQEDAFVEAVFSVEDEKKIKELQNMDVETYDNQVILSRRISQNRAVAKINGESVPQTMLKKAGELLIDIYGQNEHQSLLKKSKHLEIVDEFGGDDLLNLRGQVREAYRAYSSKKAELEEAGEKSANREKDLVFLQHEIEEIQTANLKIGEDEEIEAEYRRLKNSEKIMENLNVVYNLTNGGNGSSDSGADASSLIGHALSSLNSVVDFDEKIQDMYSALADCEGILNDFNRSVSDYMDSSSFDPEHFKELEQRLDLINDLKNKYGNSIEKILEVLNEKNEELQKLMDFDSYLAGLKAEVKELEEKYLDKAAKLTVLRKKAAEGLSLEVSESLKELNFSNVEFEFDICRTADYTSNGRDEGEFMISLNVGEAKRPLRDVASGGELSRISLALKTAVTERDGIDTLIFDEIDAGISGRTAQKVSEKLSRVANSSQVICITHLPQIAAMADTHFVVEKTAVDGETISSIRRLSRADRVDEISRMLAGVSISEKTKENAEELLDSAEDYKNNNH